MNAIETTGLTKRFRGRTAVDDLNLTIAQGEFFALLGQNGAGKTTTIRMLTCLLAPSAGDALLMGESIARNAEAAKAHSNLSPQETAIAQNLTVRENLMLIARLYGANKADATGQAEAAMREFGLSARARDRAKTLSGGMQRRISIMHEGRLQALGTAAELCAKANATNFEDAFLALTESEAEKEAAL